MNNPELYFEAHEMQKNSAIEFYNRFLTKISWHNDGSDSLIDIGSGPGDVVSDCINPRMPRGGYQRLVFSDLKSSMVEFARQHYQHLPNSDFRVLNIESHDGLPEDLKGKFDHVTSNFCLHLPADQRQAYTNIYNLLRPEGGDVLLNTAPYASFFDALTSISHNEKWLPYIQNSEVFNSALQNIEDPKGYMLDLLHSLGFRQCSVETRDRVYIFKLEAFKDMAKAIIPYIPRIPNHLLDYYLGDFVDAMSNLNPECPLYNKDNNTVRMPYKQMMIYARKPSALK
ncbi:juvenile hormone acid O-methyltransferase-like [Musca autumnalis]|uniref:juvenile hormone acid O-methyltransferase-like n=1 Tax=Musca autumnalis TaxID=221902 RepID=UPI003CF815C8